MQQDLCRFFDSVHLPDLLAVMGRLGAPCGLCALVRGFYEGHCRVFSSTNVLGAEWHQIRCGLAQGCPLSPLLAGTVMWVWHEFVEAGSSGELASCSFVDDRLLWSRSSAALRRGKQRSDMVDAAFDFTCDQGKCHFAFRGNDPAVLGLRDELGYDSAEVLVVLGLVIPLDPEAVPSLRDFDLAVVQRRLRLIGVATHSLLAKKRLLSSLVLPLFTWGWGLRLCRLGGDDCDPWCSPVRPLQGLGRRRPAGGWVRDCGLGVPPSVCCAGRGPSDLDRGGECRLCC